ncbi:MAG: TetR/AcrR family transcriptional regulator [Actinobacteria bacterium]|nr:TetR/AcrR family transcriptional regulator [Actinomycetota bacterium]
MAATQKPPAPQQRSESTVDLVLKAVIRRLEESGESHLTIDDILLETGVSKGSLYYHFGDREGLIYAARIAQYSTYLQNDSEELRSGLLTCTTFDQFVENLLGLTILSMQKNDRKIRAMRLNAISSAYGRPDLWYALQEKQHQYTNVITEVFQYGQKMGWVRTDITAHALGVFVQGHALSRILVDLDHNELEAESWVKVMKLTFDVIFTPPAK